MKPLNLDRRRFLVASAALLAARRARAEGPVPGKEALTVLGDKPINLESPVSLLDEDYTSNASHFVRNNGIPPVRAEARSLEGWSLAVDGEVGQPLSLSYDALRRDFETVERALVLECAGNGRAGFVPSTAGNQWTLGAVGCAKYRGVRLRDVLRAAKVSEKAVFVAYYGEDAHLSGDPAKSPISRGVPLAKALDEHTILAFEMNGEPLPALHGWPLRLIAPGFPASASGKWLRRLWVRDVVHDGTKMTGMSYKMPRGPVVPGATVAEADMAIIETMPVKSLITRPLTGATAAANRTLDLRGQAWSGAGDIAAVHLSYDFGATWHAAKLAPPLNKYAWQRWTATLSFPGPGHYEVWCRATDHTGTAQPMLVPGWNPEGYLNNAMQHIAVSVA